MGSYFAAGFIKGMGENLKERQEYIRDMTQRKTDFLMQEGLKRRGQVMDARVEFQKATDFLTSRGMDEDKLIALLEENPDEIVRLANRGLTLEQKEGVSLSAEILNKAVEISSDYQPQAGSVSEALDLIMPVFTKSDYKTPEAKEKGIFAKLFGSPTEAIDRNVYGQKIMGEYTGADIAASMGGPLRKRGRMSGDVSVSYAGLGSPLSKSEIKVIQASVVDEYDAQYDSFSSTVRRSVNELQADDVSEDTVDGIMDKLGITVGEDLTFEDKRKAVLTETLKVQKEVERIGEESGNARVREMIKSPYFGVEKAIPYFKEAPSAFTTSFLGADALQKIKDYGKEVEPLEAPTVETDDQEDEPDIINPMGVDTEGLEVIDTDEAAIEYFDKNPDVQYAIVNNIVMENPDFTEKRRKESAEAVGIPTETGTAETGFEKYKEATGRDLQIQTRISRVLQGMFDGKYGEWRTGLRDTDVVEFFMGESPDLKDKEAVANAYAKLRSTEASSKVLEMIKDNPELLTELEDDPIGFVKKYMEG